MIIMVEINMMMMINSKMSNMSRNRWGDIYANTPTKKMIALYDYDPMELSPNVDMEVIITISTIIITITIIIMITTTIIIITIIVIIIQ